MADLAGASAYFALTTRSDAWEKQPEKAREAAISEAAMLISRLSFARRPPVVKIDNATYEQAYCLLDDETKTLQEVAAARAAGIQSRSITGSSESYASAAGREQGPCWIDGIFYHPLAIAWLSGYYLPSGAVRKGGLEMGQGVL